MKQGVTCGKRKESFLVDKIPILVQEVIGVKFAWRLPLLLVVMDRENVWEDDGPLKETRF